ncbi:MAG: glycine dehydrogenase, partial [Planctomycetota bacterium]
MNYVQNTDADRAAMLAEIGADSIDDLMAVIPEACRFQGELDVEPALTEDALLREMKSLADRNVSAHDHPSFLGMGSYRHFCPALVDNLVSRTEYWTAYTPYQPEASQGTLTTILEWQSMMCRLT